MKHKKSFLDINDILEDVKDEEEKEYLIKLNETANLTLPLPENANEEELKKFKRYAVDLLKFYGKKMKMMSCDVPIEVLNLSDNLTRKLKSNGVERIYDFFNGNFAEIKGLKPRDVTIIQDSIQFFLSLL